MSRRAVVVGSGPNGLAAAITLAEAGLKMTVLEAESEIGGGVRSAELTMPGFIHDVCSAIYPFGRISQFFAREQAGLHEHGLRWVEPRYAIGHPLDDQPAVLLERDLDATVAGFADERDADAYRALLRPLVDNWDELGPHLLNSFNVPLNPVVALRMARFGVQALQSATRLAGRFRGHRARALFAGAAAHAILPFDEPISGATPMIMLATAHLDGWPMPAGGAGRLSAALASRLTSLGGGIETGARVDDYAQLPEHDIVLFDTMPEAMARICGEALRPRYREHVSRYRHGSAVFKLDIALDGPPPWKDARLLEAGTIHVGGSFEEIAASERSVDDGKPSQRPFVMVAQQSLFDPSRAPEGKHTIWAYCHVPNASSVDMTQPILDQLERFAPGFRSRIIAMAVSTPADIQARNANYVGGDIAGGRFDLGQLFSRPARPLDPYSTTNRRIYVCSAATPPGPGVHGMSGYHAAMRALRRAPSQS
jgi:phytoene dehydrogenase-like protein